MRDLCISVIIPVFNVFDYLKRCIVSVAEQTYNKIEIILVDDGSTDGCSQICDCWASRDRRIRTIHCPNGGLSFARNVGLDNSTGQLIMFVDSDDYIEKDACERLVSIMDEETDVVIGACRQNRGNKTLYQRHTNLTPGKEYDAKEYVVKSIKKNEWYAPVWLNLYKKAFLLDNGLRFKNGLLFEDLDLLPRVFLSNPKVRYVDYPFYNYMTREGSIISSGVTSNKQKMIIEILEGWMKAFVNVSDAEYQRYLYGILVKQYLYNCRVYRITGWRISGLDRAFACKYALDVKDYLKVMLFGLISCFAESFSYH